VEEIISFEAAAPLEKEARGCHPPEEFWVHLLQ
jgi:hypothetical protein